MSKVKSTKILGQKIVLPQTFYGMLSLLIIMVSLVLCFYIYVKLPNETQRNIADIFKSGKFDENGEPINTSETYLLGFWTPSEETAQYWNDWSVRENKAIPLDEVWEAQNVAEKREKFIQHLACDIGCPISGFRYYKVFGKGRGDSKPGYWWIATVESYYPISEFINNYKKVWGEPNSIYLEIKRKSLQSYQDEN